MAKIKTVNQAPGKMVYVGKRENEPTSFDITSYDKTERKYIRTDSLEEVLQYPLQNKISWINVKGLNDVKTIGEIGKHFKLHPLLLEDLVNTRQRPKFDEYGSYLFVVLKMFYAYNDHYVEEHFSMVLGENYLLTFQESENDVFDSVRKRIKNELSLVRNSGADYLMYTLMDAIMDNCFWVIEDVGERVEELEDNIFLEEAEEEIVQNIQNLKKEVMSLRRSIYPLREITGRLEKSEHHLIVKKTHNYLRDLNDHSIQVSESIEIYREMIWGLMDTYMSTISNKMNEVMKVLTIMASIFIPLTFIAGVYGMNFDNMPELHLKYGYFYVWGVMVVIIILLIWYFKRKKWL